MKIETMLAVISATGLVAAAIVGYVNGLTDQEAIKAGLQQCVTGQYTVWKKECEK